jgi:hypothetical protein
MIAADDDIVSGGGGWGAKRGLLSLDPETTYSPPKDDSAARFERLLEQRMDGKLPEEGIVTPGSYVQFYTAPHLSMSRGADLDKKFVLGTTPWGYSQGSDGESPASPTDIQVTHGTFGGLSRQGLFLHSASLSAAGKAMEVISKIDSPYSYVCGGGRIQPPRQ